LKDKEDLHHQLAILERDHVLQSSSTIHSEKLFEEDVQKVQDLRAELTSTNEKLEEKSEMIENLQQKLSTFEDQASVVKRLRNDLKESQLNSELFGQEVSVAREKIMKDKILIDHLESELKKCCQKISCLTEDRDLLTEANQRSSDELSQMKESLQSEIMERIKCEEKIKFQNEEYLLKENEVERISGENKKLLENLSGIQIELQEALDYGHQKDEELQALKTAELIGFQPVSEKEDFETPQDQIARLESYLEDSLNKVDVLEAKNERLSRQLEEARSEVDSHNQPEDLTILQARKIVRLECSVAIFEAEVAHLSSALTELEDQAS